jgi:chitin disaccharide deacetylase
VNALEPSRAAAATALIVNADDFGFSAGINRGIIEAHERGIVTSASLMVDQAAAASAGRYARDHPQLSVGLHLESSSAGRLLARARPSTTTADVRRQLERFRALTGRDPTHIDSHRHHHRQEPMRSAAIEVARELEVPVRHFDPRVRHCPAFYGQRYGRIYSTKPEPEAITVAALVELLEQLELGTTTELCCHPGYPEDLPLPFRKEPYRAERAVEVETLCDPEVRAAIARSGIALCSFRDFAAVV